ncbi:hypothetical protein, partial [Streptomyces sp. NPDC088178]|uniref:hypothetical protein n=1 Tax=Streptomyces sp. NPDC088178 TaxID=3365836 RepID=UPI00382D4A6B
MRLVSKYHNREPAVRAICCQICQDPATSGRWSATLHGVVTDVYGRAAMPGKSTITVHADREIHPTP